MKEMKKVSVVMIMAVAILLSSCIGSFKLTNSVYDWNKSVGDKFVNEVVFLACNIVPVYSVTLLIDGLILNSVEFWSGNNPMTMKEGSSKHKLVEIDGKTYRLTSEKYKMKVENLESSEIMADLVFHPEDNCWYMKKGNKYQKLIEVNLSNGEVVSYELTYPDGSTSTVMSDFNPVQVQNEILSGQNLALK